MCDCGTQHGQAADEMAAPAVVEPIGVPLARPIVTDSYDAGDTDLPPLPGPLPGPPFPGPIPSCPVPPRFPPFPPFPPIPPIRRCALDFRDGCSKSRSGHALAVAAGGHAARGPAGSRRRAGRADRQR